MIPQVEALAQALAKVRILLQECGYAWPDRLAKLEARLARGDKDAVVTALSEATGSAGSLRDVVIYAADGDAMKFVPEANERFDILVRDVESTAREAAEWLGLQLVR